MAAPHSAAEDEQRTSSAFDGRPPVQRRTPGLLIANEPGAEPEMVSERLGGLQNKKPDGDERC